jgi:hypothetical protein
MRIGIKSFVFISFFFGISSLFAQQETPSARIPRVSRPPKLEDFLNNTSREAELKITDFRQFDPGDGDPASQPPPIFRMTTRICMSPSSAGTILQKSGRTSHEETGPS